MTVHFTDTPAADRPAEPDLGALVWPQLRSTSYEKTTVDAVLLRVLSRALPNGVSALPLRRFLLASSDDPALVAAVAHTQRWHRLVSSARKHIAAGTGSAAGLERHRLEVARRWVARVTQPLPPGFTWAQEVNARAALSIMARQYLELGFDKIVVTAPWLGARLGSSRPHAHRVLALLENQLHWTTRAGKRSGAIRWRLAQLDNDELRDRAWLHADTVQALAAGRYGDTYLATVLASADHPAWHFSVNETGAKVLGVKSWVGLVHAHAGLSQLPGDGLGLVPATLRKQRRELERWLPGALDGAAGYDLMAELARLSAANGADLRRATHDARADADALESRRRVEKFRSDKAERFELGKQVRRVFRDVHHVDGVLGPVPATAAELASWTSRSAQHWITGHGAGVLDDAGIAVARELLADAVVKAGHDQVAAQKVAAFVFRDRVGLPSIAEG